MPFTPEVFSVLIPLGSFLMVIVIVWVVSQEKQAKARYRSEVQRELIAKFGSGRELSEFLNSEGSRQFLGTLRGGHDDQQQDPRHKVIGMITGGLICASIGGALTYVGTIWGFAFVLSGLVTLGVGGALLLSAAITYYLSKKWGLDKPVGSDFPRQS